MGMDFDQLNGLIRMVEGFLYVGLLFPTNAQ